jgi:Glycosyltransferase family 87
LTRWRWRGSVALLAVAVAFVIYPLVEGENDVINSDWPAFATGARILVTDPGHLYDFDVQRRVELEVTGGRTLITLGINGILPFVAPAYVAFFPVPFELLGTNLGGRLWILFGLACLALGLYWAVRPRAPAYATILPAFASVLPAFASVPTALLLLNAQLDGIVVLGIGAAISLWSRQYLAGLCLGLTLVKPQLMLPLGAALLATGRWRVLAGWTTAGGLLSGAAALLNPRWVFQWFPALNGPVRPGSREVDLAHFGTVLPSAYQGYGVAILSLLALVAVLALARRLGNQFRPAAAVLVAGGILVAPHALPTDLVLVASALAIWGEAKWYDWVLVSIGAAIAALAPVPVPAVVGVLTTGWVCLRAAGSSFGLRRGPATQSAG